MLRFPTRALLGTALLAVLGGSVVPAAEAAGRSFMADGFVLERISLLGGVDPDEVVALDDRIVFVARDVEELTLFVSDGTEAGTRPLRDLRTDGGARPQRLTRAGDLVFFVADDGHSGRELWITDGTFDGTRMVADLRIGPRGAAPERLFAVGDRLHFTADDGFHGREPWVSDGTERGTFMVADVEIGPPGSDPGRQVSDGDRVWFLATESMVGRSIWETDGTRAGTRRVTLDFAQGPSEPRDLAALDGRVFFSAFQEPYGRELWVSDGTVDGTSMVRDIRPGERGSDPGFVWSAGGAVWFAADDGTTGRELWHSDGTESGTYLVYDIQPGGRGSDPSDVFALGDAVFFLADDATLGREMWRTDGTLPGTDPLRDINGGRDDAFVDGGFLGQAVIDDHVLFLADDGFTGREPWLTDGTHEGTALIGNVHPDGDFRGTIREERHQGFARFRDGLVFAGTTDRGAGLWFLRPASGAGGK